MGAAAARRKRFSRPVNIEPNPAGPAGQLYNLADDPGEKRNRWLTEPKTVERLDALGVNYRPLDR